MRGRGTRSVIDLCLENGTHFKYFHWNSGDLGSVLLGLPVPLFQNVRLFTHGEKKNTTQIRRKIYIFFNVNGQWKQWLYFGIDFCKAICSMELIEHHGHLEP